MNISLCLLLLPRLDVAGKVKIFPQNNVNFMNQPAPEQISKSLAIVGGLQEGARGLWIYRE